MHTHTNTHTPRTICTHTYTHTTQTHTPHPPHTICTHTPDARLHDYIPRLFELNSTTGEFVASEVLYPARTNDPEAFPFLQSDIYSTLQPGTIPFPFYH